MTAHHSAHSSLEDVLPIPRVIVTDADAETKPKSNYKSTPFPPRDGPADILTLRYMTDGNESQVWVDAPDSYEVG
jgi:hypothetical protein